MGTAHIETARRKDEERREKRKRNLKLINICVQLTLRYV